MEKFLICLARAYVLSYMKEVDMKKFAYKTKHIIAALLVAMFLFSIVFVAASFLPRELAYAQSEDFASAGELGILQQVVSVDANKNFRFLRYDPVSFGRVYRFQQIYDGVDVIGAQMTVSVDEDGKILSYGGKFIPIASFGDKKISEAEAKNIILDKYQDDITFSQFVYYYDGKNVCPAYKLISASLTSEYYVSTLNGAVLYKNTSQYIAMQNEDAFGKKIDIEVVKEGENFVMRDEERGLSVLDFDGNTFKDDHSDLDFNDHLNKIITSSTGKNFDPMAVTVYDYVAKAYDFYLNPSNIGVARYGINDKNNNDDPSDDYKIYILMNYGKNYENADFRVLYNSSTGVKYNFGYICVGNGTMTEGELYEQGKAFDILAHEYQHGVTAFTAGFKYEGESGALDEAFSDIFGALVEGCDPSDFNSGFWTIGENGVYDPENKGLYHRSLIGGTPGQAYNVKDQNICRGFGPHSTHDCDNNYVHDNSTIISHVQYELSKLAPEFFTREKIGTFWYTTLLKLTANSNFLDFTNAFVNSAAELDFPKDILDKVKQALTSVGLINDGQHTIKFFFGPEYDMDATAQVNDKSYFNYNNFAFKGIIENDIRTDKFTYKFVGWQNRDGSDFDFTNFDRVTENISVYAAYDIYCDVTFVDENNNILENREVPFDANISPFEYSTFDAQRYSFLGWRTANMNENEYIEDWSNYSILSHTTFIPVLLVNSYTVRFFSDSTLIGSQTLTYGSLVQLPTNDSLTVKHDGLVLEGWYLNEELTLKADNFNITDNINLYAKWVDDEAYSQTKLAIIIGASFAALFIICIPIIIIVTKRRKR